jgi:hypothetical protein
MFTEFFKPLFNLVKLLLERCRLALKHLFFLFFRNLGIFAPIE